MMSKESIDLFSSMDIMSSRKSQAFKPFAASPIKSALPMMSALPIASDSPIKSSDSEKLSYCTLQEHPVPKYEQRPTPGEEQSAILGANDEQLSDTLLTKIDNESLQKQLDWEELITLFLDTENALQLRHCNEPAKPTWLVKSGTDVEIVPKSPENRHLPHLAHDVAYCLRRLGSDNCINGNNNNVSKSPFGSVKTDRPLCRLSQNIVAKLFCVDYFSWIETVGLVKLLLDLRLIDWETCLCDYVFVYPNKSNFGYWLQPQVALLRLMRKYVTWQALDRIIVSDFSDISALLHYLRIGWQTLLGMQFANPTILQAYIDHLETFKRPKSEILLQWIVRTRPNVSKQVIAYMYNVVKSFRSQLRRSTESLSTIYKEQRQLLTDLYKGVKRSPFVTADTKKILCKACLKCLKAQADWVKKESNISKESEIDVSDFIFDSPPRHKDILSQSSPSFVHSSPDRNRIKKSRTNRFSLVDDRSLKDDCSPSPNRNRHSIQDVASMHKSLDSSPGRQRQTSRIIEEPISLSPADNRCKVERCDPINPGDKQSLSITHSPSKQRSVTTRSVTNLPDPPKPVYGENLQDSSTLLCQSTSSSDDSSLSKSTPASPVIVSSKSHISAKPSRSTEQTASENPTLSKEPTVTIKPLSEEKSTPSTDPTLSVKPTRSVTPTLSVKPTLSVIATSSSSLISTDKPTHSTEPTLSEKPTSSGSRTLPNVQRPSGNCVVKKIPISPQRPLPKLPINKNKQSIASGKSALLKSMTGQETDVVGITANVGFTDDVGFTDVCNTSVDFQTRP